ncbi:MAG: hypothetical protein HY832_00635 [Candidatus Aenigmarchaeota archaeon]|nr:hypothetical protein [Candidatus Aenigmarchaeota archaeon]
MGVPAYSDKCALDIDTDKYGKELLSCARLVIPYSEIQQHVLKLQRELNELVSDQPFFAAPVLDGADRFCTDLIEPYNNANRSPLRFKSYRRTQSTGMVDRDREILDSFLSSRKIHEPYPIVVVEDILDNGYTLADILSFFHENNIQCSDFSFFVLLNKPGARKTKCPEIDMHVGCTIPNFFVIGYGLDYDGHFRKLNNIYEVTDEEQLKEIVRTRQRANSVPNIR